MILTDREIQIALSRHQIFIEPSPVVEAYSSTSVDLTLDENISEFRDDLSNDPVETIIDPSHKNFVAERTLAYRRCAKMRLSTRVPGTGIFAAISPL